MHIKIKRFDSNPIIHPGLDASIGSNINGPSLIRVPDWVENPLGKYYLYFAHHQGRFIRMAYADSLEGPWSIYRPGVLKVEATAFHGHVASPDVHIDASQRRLVMYFHGVAGTENHFVGQRSGVALSTNGLDFKPASDDIIAPFYLRVFRHADRFFGVAKSIEKPGGGVLLESDDPLGPFRPVREIIPRMRHAAVLVRSGRLFLFYSRGEDAPERILVSTADPGGAPEEWRFSDPREVLQSARDYEGVDYPLVPSRFGAIHEPVHQLRDPAVFRENDRTFLIYSCAGESALAVAEMSF